jgi:hypothetical protein
MDRPEENISTGKVGALVAHTRHLGELIESLIELRN